MLKVWGRTTSINVQKVLWALAELDVAYERIDAGLHFGVNSEPWYREMNPNATVPTIDDEGFVLWESNAIVRYLAAKHGMGTLCPSDPAARADADRWMEWHSTTVWAESLRWVFFNMYRAAPDKRNAAQIEAGAVQAITHFTRLDRHLAQRSWVTGETFTMGDIPLGAAAHRFFGVPIERPPLPNVEAWYARLLDRP
ncbi:MAG: glutathione S-transferase family protein, partial [Proteobacteria bacterium]|nr:glutathione S-transferase family protein [Burkholderiales bacterium]